MPIIGDYEYGTEKIGSGSFAIVYKGWLRRDPKRLVAVKEITKKTLQKSKNLLDKEIKILKELNKLNHKHVVKMLDCIETKDCVCVVMEYCNCKDLSDYMSSRTTLSEDTIRILVTQLAEVLKTFHEKEIVHRDLKPQNILLLGPPELKPGEIPPASKITFKVADFGFARFLTEGAMAATLCGSPMYMAPEVITSQKYTSKADLFSVGTILYQCLTGRPPYQADNPQKLKYLYQTEEHLKPKLPVGTSKELTDLIESLMKNNPNDRIEFKDFFNHNFLLPKEATYDDLSTVDLPPVPTLPVTLGTRTPHDGHLYSRMLCRSPPVEVSPKYVIESQQAPTSIVFSSGTDEDFVLVSSNFDQIIESGGERYKTPPGKSLQDYMPAETLVPGYFPATEPIPVPNQRSAFEKMLRKNSETEENKESSLSKSPSSVPRTLPIAINTKETREEIINSLSPPSMQFVIGTPPGGGRKKSISSSISESLQSMLQRASPMTGLSPPNQVAQLGCLSTLSNSSSLMDNNNCQNLLFSKSGRTQSSKSEKLVNINSPIRFLPPELPEETLLDRTHNEILAKVNYALLLSNCVMEVATGRTNLMTQLHHDPGHTSMIEDVVVDQFVLFYKALNYLEAALSLAHTRIKDGNLHQTNAVVKVVTSLNQKFCECLNAVKRLLKGGVGEVVKPMRISADELLYNYAVTLCALASTAELQKKYEECFRKYEKAHILLHSLRAVVKEERDSAIIQKYIEMVEIRLNCLREKGVIYQTELKIEV